MQKLSRKEKRLTEKPWISKDILKSIRTKNKLFRSHYHSRDPNKKLIYKQYLNKLTLIKKKTWLSDFTTKIFFCENQGNSCKTWSIVGELINYKNHKNKSKIPPTIEIDKKLYKTNSSAFLNKLCEYFANIGANMCKNLLKTDNADSKLVIHSKSCIQSFVFHEITNEEVTRHINAMKIHTTPGLDGISSNLLNWLNLL